LSELDVQGLTVSCRYWEDEEHTSAVMKKDEDGILWMHTGDQGIMDEEGYLRSTFFFESLNGVTDRL